MSDINPKASKEDLLKALTLRARLLWGPERAQSAQKTIAETADYIWALRQDPIPMTEPIAGYPTPY
ncbi:MAG: hypothetical protein O2854_00535 [Chloroflexi bacterium]|nr:hypothetical protein [Chloroflexota bacterium]